MQEKEYINVGDKPAELSSGRLLPVGDHDSVDLKSDMDKALIEAGTLVPFEGKDEQEA